VVDIVMTDLAEERGMKLGFGGTKGGTGKTTIAVHAAAWLAARGRRVLLIDADEQQTAMDWVAAREEARLNDSDYDSVPHPEARTIIWNGSITSTNSGLF
jgi:cellulose biosynthesis protein BcsQ